MYRDGSWSLISAENVLPGDIVSVGRTSQKDDIVPCDCLLLRGSAIVNESTLTGNDVILIHT